MRRLRSAGLSAGLVLLLLQSGCNVFVNGQVGPVVAFGEEKEVYTGAEVNTNFYIDVLASKEWFAGLRPPEVARRWGANSGAYLRSTNAGFALGMRPGIFTASTSSKLLLLGSLGGSLGLQTLDRNVYGSAGLYGALTVGFPVRKAYDPSAILLCRSLTYVTMSAQAMIDFIPAADRSLPGLGFYVGLLGLEDSGAPSDAEDPLAHCPR